MLGKFIVLEGLDGVGKSVQSDLLVKRLKELGEDVILVRAPGGTEEGKVIRQLVLSKGVSPVTEMLLFAADRAELAHSVILPTLKRGTWVVSDRYLDSSRAYQGALGHDHITSETIEKLHADFISECEPDLTILLSASKEETYKRMNERGSSDLIEDRNSDYRSRVEKEFARIALTDKKRPHVSVSTDNAIEETSDKILRAVKDHFKL